jgi:hypothetical protein
MPAPHCRAPRAARSEIAHSLRTSVCAHRPRVYFLEDDPPSGRPVHDRHRVGPSRGHPARARAARGDRPAAGGRRAPAGGRAAARPGPHPVPEMLDDTALAELTSRLALVEAVVSIDALELPDGPEPHVLAAADRVVRREAAREGWLPVPHSRLALPVALGEPIFFARLTGRIDELDAPIGLVPYWTERGPSHRATAFALLTRGLARRVHRSGWRVARVRSKEVANRRPRRAPARFASHGWRVVHALREEVANRRARRAPAPARRGAPGVVPAPRGAPGVAPAPRAAPAPAPRPTARAPDSPLLHRCRSIPPPAQGGARSAPPRPRLTCRFLAHHRHRAQPPTQTPSRSLAQHTAQTHRTTHLAGI